MVISGRRSRPPVSRFVNRDLTNIQTPIDADELERLLILTNYDEKLTTYLVDGFRTGFDLGYRGPSKRMDSAENIPFTVGDQWQMWEKIMKEVRLGHYAGPFEKIPFKHFMQSPVGLVPKVGGDTRLIFHLSYKFPNGNPSFNESTPTEWCTVKYCDLDQAVIQSIKISEGCCKKLFYSKTDLQSAFRIVPSLPSQWKFLILKAKDPESGKINYFADKNLPFGSSISCSLFTKISEALKHIVQKLANKEGGVINYLDDFLFIDVTQVGCNAFLDRFINICNRIKFPVSEEKTVRAKHEMIFLGILLNGYRFVLVVPDDKRRKALFWVQKLSEKRKSTIKEIAETIGYLELFK